MVLISIHPFALRKLFLVAVALVCFSAFCFADPVLMVRQSKAAKTNDARSGLPHSTQVTGLPEATLGNPAENADIPSFRSSAAYLRGCEWRKSGAASQPGEFTGFEMGRI